MFHQINKVIRTKEGRALISIILGLGLASLFRKICNGKDCLEFRAPSSLEDKETIYSHNNKCYSVEGKSMTCSTTRKTIDYA